MQRKLVSLIVSLVAVMMIVAGCDSSTPKAYSHVASYFNGAIVAEYNQVRRPDNDYMRYRIYQAGQYDISYSIPPEKGSRNSDVLPDGFTQTVNAPAEIVKEQYRIPDFLRVTIKWNGQTESHDFA